MAAAVVAAVVEVEEELGRLRKLDREMNVNKSFLLSFHFDLHDFRSTFCGKRLFFLIYASAATFDYN